MHLKALQPLSRRLPLLMILLLSAIVAGVSWVAYAQIRRATLDASQSHLDNAARQVATLLDSSLRRVRRQLASSAADQHVVAALLAPAPAADSVISRSLDAFRARVPQYVAVSVWSRSGSRIATSGSPELAQATGIAAVGGTSRGLRVSRFSVVHDTLAYAVVAPVVAAPNDTLGYVVGTLRIGGSRSGNALGRLLGPGTRLFIGNADGGRWTDLDSIVVGPPRSVLGKPGASSYTGTNGEAYLGVTSSVTAAPWVVWVEVPKAVALATAREFLLRVIVAGAVFVLAGALGVWSISRRVIRRLEAVRSAAEVLAMGQSPARVADGRDDEIGCLATSFNTMAEHVQAANRQLADRAAALEERNEKLRDSEARYRQLVDQSPDAVLVHRKEWIVFANAVAARMVGVDDAAQLIGRSIFDLVDKEQQDEARERIAGIVSSRRASKLAELRLRRLDGGTLIAEVSGAPIVFDAQPAIQTLARDVSERKSLEDQLRQSQKMEAVGRLAGGIAHDFNNLLTVINTYAELTLARMSDDDPTRADIEAIGEAGASAARLTRQILAFSRKQVLAPRVLDINESITGLTGLLQRLLGDQVNVVTELRPSLGPIFADAGQLEQVLMNLAVNARDAMPNGGTLKIETAEVELGEGYEGLRRPIPRGCYIMLGVSDTGVGMTADIKEHLFEPFFTTKQQGEGTGLGLATVYGIVKQSGGDIWVYSEPGQGSTFKIYFPRYAGDGEEAAGATGEFAITALQAARVLLVEDDRTVRAAVRRILDRSPHQVTEADSGVDALRVFRAHGGRIDLVITDMVMPNMSGAELIRELREFNPELRAIIMSGYSEEATTRGWRLPPNAVFLEKPLSPLRLLRAVTEALGALDA